MANLCRLPLLFWGSADYEYATYGAGSKAGWTNLAEGTWADGFGNVYDKGDATGNCTVQASGGPAGGPSLTLPSVQILTFDGVGWVQPGVGGFQSGNYSSGEMFAVVKASGPTARSDWFNIGASSIDARYPNSDGDIWDEFGGGNYTFTPSLDVSSWRTFSSRNSGASRVTRLDGVVQYTDTSGFGLPQHQPNLGSSGGGGGFLGSITSFYLFSRSLTDAERAQVEAWIAANPSGGLPHPCPTVAPPARLFPRADGLGVGSGRHFPPAQSQQRSGRRFGYY